MPGGKVRFDRGDEGAEGLLLPYWLPFPNRAERPALLSCLSSARSGGAPDLCCLRPLLSRPTPRLPGPCSTEDLRHIQQKRHHGTNVKGRTYHQYDPCCSSTPPTNHCADQDLWVTLEHLNRVARAKIPP
jgi:hypothetical protein